MLSFLQGLHAHLPVSPWIILLGAIVSYHVVRSIYLIYFSPLSIFPGSKWAAIGEYWEAYWNIGVTPGRKGQTLFKLEKMHHELGPAIRLGPNEVHVYDPNFYHELYRSGSRYYKDPQMHKVFGAPSSTVAECDPAKHKVRRAPLESLFAKVNTNKLEPSLLRNLDVLSQRFDSMYAAGKPISMEWALKSLTMGMFTPRNAQSGTSDKQKTLYRSLSSANRSTQWVIRTSKLCPSVSSLDTL